MPVRDAALRFRLETDWAVLRKINTPKRDREYCALWVDAPGLLSCAEGREVSLLRIFVRANVSRSRRCNLGVS
jgi:hypothetical protein